MGGVHAYMISELEVTSEIMIIPRKCVWNACVSVIIVIMSSRIYKSDSSSF